MHAITVPEPGDADVMTWAEVPDPQPRAGEVVIEVVAAGVNRADVMQRKGFYPPPADASPYLGLECSGRVVAYGEGVDAQSSGFAIGDEVCALLVGGGYAEKVAVPVGQVMPVPAGMSIVEAAGLVEVACTVWSNVFMLAGLRQGETLLVHGGTSGIGTLAIQLAKRAGARVVVTCGTEEKCARAVELGADVAVNYREQDFVEEVLAVTGAHGADVVLDNMGAKYLERNVRVLAPNGRLVVIGLQGGTKAELNLNVLLQKRAAVLATSLRARPLEEKAAIVASVREHVWPMVEAGDIRLVVDRTMDVRDAAEAHRVMEASDHIGKILLTVAQ
jgi:putative PIG3 family NAD(P)H quinone oxidoreductase